MRGFFLPAARHGMHFDLAGFHPDVALKLRRMLMIDDIGADTYSDERFL